MYIARTFILGNTERDVFNNNIDLSKVESIPRFAVSKSKSNL